ncbi:MAG: dienelactone hydrolase family protein [Myxococcota bacterium]
MCDERAFADHDEFVRSKELTRREFGVLSAGVGVAMLWPEFATAAGTSAVAAEVVGEEVVVKTPDGQADCHFVRPKNGKHPGVILWPDAFGLRTAMRQMGKRLAASGHSVLVVNPYYRKTKAPFLPEGASFADPETREKIMAMMGSLSAATHMADAKAFVDWLDAQPGVDRARRIGTLGYCMGGPITLRTAASRPDRVGAAASFHGGGLVTDKPDSPHLLIPQMKADFLIAIAANDDEQEPKVKDVLRETFAKNHLTAEIEVYAGALHGWCPPDMPVYDEEKAERAWSRLLALFGTALAKKA